VDTIVVTGNSTVSQQEIIDMARIESEIKLFEANEKLISQAVELHPMVKQAQLIRHLPRTLEITVTERIMWAVVPVADEFLIIDTEGVCINKTLQFPNTEVPVITIEPVPQQIILGQALEPRGMDLISKVWEGLSDRERDQVSDFHYTVAGQELIIYTLQGTEIKFGEDERLDEKLSTLSQVFQLEQDFMETGQEDLIYVDMRYKGQPVVKTTF
jgi:cell division protein FtsQ